MSIKQAWITQCIAAAFIMGSSAAFATDVACPPNEMPANKGAQTCVKRDAPKPQVDASQYKGAQKTQAEACNKANTAQGAIVQSADEIARINNSLNEAYHHKQKPHEGHTKAEAEGEIAKWKEQRIAEEGKLRAAQKELNAAKKEHRAAAKAVKKEGAKPLECL